MIGYILASGYIIAYLIILYFCIKEKYSSIFIDAWTALGAFSFAALIIIAGFSNDMTYFFFGAIEIILVFAEIVLFAKAHIPTYPGM